MKWIRSSYKIVTILLLSYVLIKGILTPIKPGIIDVLPSRFRCDSNYIIRIQSYNTHLLEMKDQISIWLKIDHYLHALTVKEVISDNVLIAELHVPSYLPSKQKLTTASLLVDNPKDGTCIIPSKIIIGQDSLLADTTNWTAHWNSTAKFHYLKNSHFPYRNILYETIRNTFFHVSLWFAMFLLLISSVYYSILYLNTFTIEYDIRSYALVRVGILFGILGCITGSIWAKFTWDTWWTRDIKLNMAALSMLIYFTYLILRNSISSVDLRARISAVFNIFSLVAIIPLLFIIPRLTDSLHPGNGGNPAFGSEDMDNALRIVFYPAILGFTGLGAWIAEILSKIDKIDYFLTEKENY